MRLFQLVQAEQPALVLMEHQELGPLRMQPMDGERRGQPFPFVPLQLPLDARVGELVLEVFRLRVHDGPDRRSRRAADGGAHDGAARRAAGDPADHGARGRSAEGSGAEVGRAPGHRNTGHQQHQGRSWAAPHHGPHL